mmetsp:Transcript_1746/g.2429  ORF Transcript_1746/g.2429 Transcript_1746/m.2429 type:complete len:344 (-) Transcript_1746:57-1088(-)
MRILKVIPFFMFGSAVAFAPNANVNIERNAVRPSIVSHPSSSSNSALFSSNMPNDDGLGQKFGGYTAKQRLREEVESPFRQVRLFFFGGSAGSAMVALYFSALSVLKASMGGFEDAQPMDEALQSCAINLGAVVVCAALAWRDYQAGEANLARIAKGGALARLAVSPASTPNARTTLTEYRRTARVLLAAGGKEYIAELARSLNSDQLADTNTLAEAIEAVDVILVPVLLESDGRVGDTRTCWLNTVPEEDDRNFDIERANNIVSFPVGNAAWTEYLESEIETCKKQGFDVINKGFTIVVKKNGRILRRATGQPQWGGFIETMEVMDGSKFGMPGDSEKYGGP